MTSSNSLPKIGISTCLLGEKVRYDGKHKRNVPILNAFSSRVNWISVCPEAEVGMGIPRETIGLYKCKEFPLLLTNTTRIDHTQAMLSWIHEQLTKLEEANVSGYIFKSGSPSCGIVDIKIRDDDGNTIEKGQGIFAAAVAKRWPELPIAEEQELKTDEAREAFLERVLSYSKR